ncbi:uncharacterized protein BDV14DRAFT_70249 [Aspergillus stella-maris]|uniref:uncharacterized protein n=1 Tax=Aspergillus stella-maris TaxID=1810926 RepID=UPI003CCDECB3
MMPIVLIIISCCRIASESHRVIFRCSHLQRKLASYEDDCMRWSCTADPNQKGGRIALEEGMCGYEIVIALLLSALVGGREPSSTVEEQACSFGDEGQNGQVELLADRPCSKASKLQTFKSPNALGGQTANSKHQTRSL